MNTADPDRSPAGTETAWAYTHLPRGRHHDADLVAETVEQLEAAVERAAPGFRAGVLARKVRGPVELEAANPNLRAGTMNGGTAALHQQLFLRPHPGLGRADSPIGRLFLAGSSAHPGGGVHGACGANAARAALAAGGRFGPLYRGVTRGLNRAILDSRADPPGSADEKVHL
jgi:phytoene dehydrogenase-like protein